MMYGLGWLTELDNHKTTDFVTGTQLWTDKNELMRFCEKVYKITWIEDMIYGFCFRTSDTTVVKIIEYKIMNGGKHK